MSINKSTFGNKHIGHFISAALLCMGLSITTGAHAQQLQAEVTHYSTDDGLCSNAVSDIIQDGNGYLWIATWNGLSRFDGFNFFNYTTGRLSGNPLLHNRIMDLTADFQQNIWLRMYDGRVFVLNRNEDRIINAFEGIAGNANFRTTCKLKLTEKGYILASIDGVGIYRMKLTNKGMSHQLISTSQLTPNVMVEGYQDDIWVGTDKGFHRLDANDELLSSKAVFAEENITCAYSNGYHIYGGTSSGRIVYFAYGQEPIVIKEVGQPIAAVYVDSHKMVWFATKNPGICRLDPHTGEIKQFNQWVPVPEYDVHGSRIEEVDGVLWATMSHGGFGYYNRERDEMEYFHNDPANPWNLSNTVAAWLVLPGGVIWESTSKKGLEKLMLQNNTISRRLPFAAPNTEEAGPTLSTYNDIRALYSDSKRQQMLIANKNGQLLISNGKDAQHLIDRDNEGKPLGRIYGINADRQGNYWIATKGNGIIKLSLAGNRQVFTHYSTESGQVALNNANAYCSIEDNKGNIWIGTYGGGVNILTRQGGKLTMLHKDNHLHAYPQQAYGKVRTLATDKDGTIWVGTTDGILLMSIEGERVNLMRLDEVMSKERPINCNDIVCLTRSPEGEMWIGTNGGGLSRCLGKDDDGLMAFENIGSQQGLPSEEIKSITFDKSANLWISTDHIISSYNPTKHILSSFSMLDGVDNTICEENAAITLNNGQLLFGTINGYYVVDQKKLASKSAIALKLRITDFFYDGKLMTPRTDSTFTQYVPSLKEVVLPERGVPIAFRFASLNYQLQHRVHYQYMMEGYDREWQDAGKDRMAEYETLPSGTYRFKVRAFLLASPDQYDVKVMTVVVPAPFLLSKNSIWLYMALLAALMIGGIYYRQKKFALRQMSIDEAEKTQEEDV